MIIGWLRGILILFTMSSVSLFLFPFQQGLLWIGSPLSSRLPQLYHRLFCKLVGIRITQRGTFCPDKYTLLVANHASWLDIPVLSSVAPISFVAKSEVRSWPVAGLCARLQKSVFVNRTRRRDVYLVGKEISQRIKRGDHLLVFPETTTSDGRRLLPFHGALIGGILRSFFTSTTPSSSKSLSIHPLCIAYTHWQGLPIGRSFRAKVAWFGGAPLLPHFWRIICSGGIDVTVSWGTPQSVSQDTPYKSVVPLLEEDIRRILHETLV